MGLEIKNLKDPKLIATAIFNFEPFQSCSIFGMWVDPSNGEAIPKGMYVVKLLKEMYKEKYYEKGIRSRVHYANSVGGYVAHPIWKYKLSTIDAEPEKDLNENRKVNIWRVQ